MRRNLRIAVAGLGGAGAKILPRFEGLDGVELAAAADVRPAARNAFEAEYRRPVFPTVAAMCRSPDVDAVYVATPSPLHCEHTLEAVHAGKHVMCEKPLAISLGECDRMIDAADRAGVVLLQAHSKVLEPPVRSMREIIDSGRLGEVFHVDNCNYNDWMRRPRLPSELDTAAGGGVVLRQAPQQVDMVRYLVGREPKSVRAVAGRRAPGLDAEGDFSALIMFDGGATASVSLNGYGYFDIAEALYPGAAQVPPLPLRLAPATVDDKYGETQGDRRRRARMTQRLPLCGMTVVSCERGILRESSQGLYLHSDQGREEICCRDARGLAAGLLELRDAVREGRRGFPDGAWARTTLEVCLAILESSRRCREIEIGRLDGGTPR